MKPNLVFPLAVSYNPRGVNGYTTIQTDGKDQRKINCFYETVKNSATGGGQVYLTKRPGVTINAGTFGASTQVPYLIVTRVNNTSYAGPWLIVKDGNNTKVTDGSTTTTVLNSANYQPAYVDRTNPSGTQTVVLQLFDTSNLTNPQKVYFSSAIATWTEITDGTFTALSHAGKMEYMDGYAFVIDSQTNRIHNSAINSLATWDGDYITKEITQDYSFGLARLRNQILAFGDETVEMFYNAGNPAGSPLGRLAHLHQRIGLGAMARLGTGTTHYYCTVGERMYFLGKPASGGYSNALMSYDGARFEKVSTPMIDSIISQSGVYSVNRFGFQGHLAVAIQLTLPTASTQRWLMFFPELNDWFEWESTVFGPVNNGVYFTGVASTDKIYSFEISNKWQDNTTDYTTTVQFQLPGNDDYEWKHMQFCGVEADNTSSSSTLTISKSDNDYVSFSTLGTVDLANDRKVLHRCGTYRHRAIKLTHTDSKELRIKSFYAYVG